MKITVKHQDELGKNTYIKIVIDENETTSALLSAISKKLNRQQSEISATFKRDKFTVSRGLRRVTPFSSSSEAESLSFAIRQENARGMEIYCPFPNSGLALRSVTT